MCLHGNWVTPSNFQYQKYVGKYLVQQNSKNKAKRTKEMAPALPCLNQLGWFYFRNRAVSMLLLSPPVCLARGKRPAILVRTNLFLNQFLTILRVET